MIEIEKRGVPTVVVVTRPFVEDAKVTAEMFGIPNLSFAVLELNTCSNVDDEAIRKASDAVTHHVLNGLLKIENREQALGQQTETKPEYQLETFRGHDKLKAWEEFNARFLEKGWGDGFPLVPPTEEKVNEILKGTSKNSDDVITILQPGMGIATVKIIAINAVMAGCQPKHLPVLIAAVKAMNEPEFQLRIVAMSTGPHTPMLVVNGPVARELNINSGRGALGPGKESASNTVLGRAIRLILMNVGHAYLNSMDMDTLGSPNKYSMCIAENEKDSPWKPYHVSRGYASEESTVTVFSVEAQFGIFDTKNNTPDGILTSFAGTINSIGTAFTRSWFIPRRRSDCAVLLSPAHAKAIASAGWDKDDVQAFLYRESRLPVKLFKNTEQMERVKPSCRWILDAPDDMLLPVVGSQDWFHILVVGGPGGKSSFTAGVGKAITKKIEL